MGKIHYTEIYCLCNRFVAVHSLRIKDVDSVCGDKELVAVHKNPKAVPTKMALMTKMPMAMGKKRFVH